MIVIARVGGCEEKYVVYYQRLTETDDRVKYLQYTEMKIRRNIGNHENHREMHDRSKVMLARYVSQQEATFQWETAISINSFSEAQGCIPR